MLYQTGEDEKKQSRNPSALGGGPPPLAANEVGEQKRSKTVFWERKCTLSGYLLHIRLKGM